MVLDDPDQLPWVRQVMMMMRMTAPSGDGVNAYFNRRRHQAKTVAPSMLRQALRGGVGGVGGVAW
jgi:hypothetical protein